MAGRLKDTAAARQGAVWASAAASLSNLATALDSMEAFVRGRLGSLESRLHLATGHVAEAVRCVCPPPPPTPPLGGRGR